jgi:hypothetical protein
MLFVGEKKEDILETKEAKKANRVIEKIKQVHLKV